MLIKQVGRSILFLQSASKTMSEDVIDLQSDSKATVGFRRAGHRAGFTQRQDTRGCRWVAFDSYKLTGLLLWPFVFIENLLPALILFYRVSFRFTRGQAGFEI